MRGKVSNSKQLAAKNLTLYFGQHEYWDYNGARKMFNTSVESGYSCKIVRYPDYNFSAVVLGNDGVYNSATATTTSKFHIENYFTKTPVSRGLVKANGIKMDTKILENFIGTYTPSR